jgi:hypothetical protein
MITVNKERLRAALKALEVKDDGYCLNGGHPSEAYVLAHDGRRWRVYYSERGGESSPAAFDTEAEACSHLFALLKADLSTRRERR